MKSRTEYNEGLIVELKDKIFRSYCSISSDIMAAGHCILSSKYIAKRYNITLYRARKIIKELVADGLLVADYEGGYSDWDCMVHCYRGYRVTKRATQTREYKEEKWKNCKAMAKSFGGTAYSYYI